MKGYGRVAGREDGAGLKDLRGSEGVEGREGVNDEGRRHLGEGIEEGPWIEREEKGGKSER